ncbi:MAG: ABC transporter ATP-binding protein [Actinomycetota bacterium]|nr:ABC transporter ATP-binding protein [Actinomycetota bacterium]
MAKTLVKVEDLHKVYMPSPLWMGLLLRSAIREPIVALNGVSFEVQEGEICAVVGPNGAGKSTMFRIITGLITPTSGRALVMERDAARQSDRVRKVVGFMPAEDRTLWLRHTCRENLLFHGRLRGFDRNQLRTRVDEVLELVGLGQARDRAGFALSSGMRARLQLARALLHRPRVLILDEPTGALDPVGAFEFLEVIKELVAEEQQAVLISSHRLEEIEALEQDVILLDRGRLVYDGDLSSLRSMWGRPRIQISFANPDSVHEVAKLVDGMDEVQVLSKEALSITLTCEKDMGELLSQLDGEVAHVTSITQSRIPLRELLANMLLNPNVEAAGAEGQQ